MLPADAALFLYTYIRKEAVLSSMIEGTQSSLSDLLLFESDSRPGVPLDDVREVSGYVAAMYCGLRRLEEGAPLSNRLLREIHGVLLNRGRGSAQEPGKFRRSQNWIGGTRPGNAVFVPPPPSEIAECMGKLELFLHDRPKPVEPLLKAALAHVQFETIHPFLDGNGRLGRLLITLILCGEGVLRMPLLYLSLYFKTHRRRYYELLNSVRLTGDWEAWLEFFAEAVAFTAEQAAETVQKLVELSNGDRGRLAALGRAESSALKIHRALMKRPVAAAALLAQKAGLPAVTANKALDNLEKLGIVRELTGKRRGRVFAYTDYIEIMNGGTERP
jgi:Fic family protein